jgi:hypothetical protein
MATTVTVTVDEGFKADVVQDLQIPQTIVGPSSASFVLVSGVESSFRITESTVEGPRPVPQGGPAPPVVP